MPHEPLLGPEAVLESSKARREHGYGAAEQATCKWSQGHNPAHTHKNNKNKTDLWRTYFSGICFVKVLFFIYLKFISTAFILKMHWRHHSTPFYRHFFKSPLILLSYLSASEALLPLSPLQHKTIQSNPPEDHNLSRVFTNIWAPSSAKTSLFELHLFSLELVLYYFCTSYTTVMRWLVVRWIVFVFLPSMPQTWRRSKMTLRTKNSSEPLFSMETWFRFVFKQTWHPAVYGPNCYHFTKIWLNLDHIYRSLTYTLTKACSFKHVLVAFSHDERHIKRKCSLKLYM